MLVFIVHNPLNSLQAKVFKKMIKEKKRTFSLNNIL